MLSFKIGPELTQVIWIDSAGGGEVRRDVISGDDVKVVGDTLIVVNRDQDGVGQKLVLSGYRSGAGSLLFGAWAIAVTHPSNPAYPAVLLIMVPFGDNGEPLVMRLQLVGRYAGDGEAFSGWRSRVGERLRREWKEAHPLINREGAEESEPEVPVN